MLPHGSECEEGVCEGGRGGDVRGREGREGGSVGGRVGVWESGRDRGKEGVIEKKQGRVGSKEGA